MRGLGFRVRGLGFRGLGFRVRGLGVRVLGSLGPKLNSRSRKPCQGPIRTKHRDLRIHTPLRNTIINNMFNILLCFIRTKIPKETRTHQRTGACAFSVLQDCLQPT